MVFLFNMKEELPHFFPLNQHEVYFGLRFYLFSSTFKLMTLLYSFFFNIPLPLNYYFWSSTFACIEKSWLVTQRWSFLIKSHNGKFLRITLFACLNCLFYLISTYFQATGILGLRITCRGVGKSGNWYFNNQLEKTSKDWGKNSQHVIRSLNIPVAWKYGLIG